MAEGKPKPTGSTAGATPPPPTAPDLAPARRRVLAAPANDNRLSPLHRLLRAAAFVAIGAALAWVMHYVLG
ncbi:MAG TPA: hypothetical protein VGB82_04875 [Alphaproteobacteria bacterium]